MSERQQPLLSLDQAPDATPASLLQPLLVQDTQNESAISEPQLVRVDQATAHDLFAAHIVRVEDEGGIRRVQRVEPKKGTAFVLGGAACEIGMTISEYQTMPFAVAGSTLAIAAGLGLGGTQLWRRRHARKRFERENGMPLLENIGHAYEVYRFDSQDAEEKPTTAVHWHGATVPKETRPSNYPSFLSSVRSIVRLAEQSQVDTIIVDRAVLKKGMPLCKVPEDGSIGARQLAEATQLDIGSKVIKKIDAICDLRTFSPKEFRTYVETELGVAGLDSLMENLAETVSSDPMVSLYRQLQAANAEPGAMRSALLTASRQALERNLEADPRIRGSLATDDPTKISVRSDIACRIVVDKVHVQRTIHTKEGTRTTSSIQGLGESLPLSDMQRTQFDADPSLLTTHQRKLVLYEKLYNTARDEETTGERGEGSSAKPSNPVIATEENLVQSTLVAARLSPIKRRKIVKSSTGEQTKIRMWSRTLTCGIFAASAATGVGVFHHETMSAIQSQVSKRADAQAAQGISSNYSQLADEAWQAHAPYYHFVQQAQTESTAATVDYLANNLGPMLPDSWIDDYTGVIAGKEQIQIDDYQNKHTISNSRIAGVGNNDVRSVNEVDWYLSPHKMDTAGYWGTQTFTAFIGSRWNSDRPGVQRWPEDLPTTIPKNNDSYIAVSRMLIGSDFGEMALPILSGTHPVAVNLDGKPLRLHPGDDGSYTAIIRKPGKLTYYLDTDKNHSEGLRATDNAFVGQSEIGEPSPADLWKYEVPNRVANGLARRHQEMAFIQQNFAYSLQPLSDKDMGYDGMTGLLLNAFDAKKANCNVAATMLIADNVSLNYAEGWHNTNSSGKQQVLSSHETHAWAVDANRKIYDATPAADPNDKLLSAYFDESKIVPPDTTVSISPEKPIGIGLAALGVAGMAHFMYRRRRPIVNVARKTLRGLETTAAFTANIVADSPGVTRNFAVAARELPYMNADDDVAKRRRQFVDAVERVRSGRVSTYLSDAEVGSASPVLNQELASIGVSWGTRLAVRTRLAARRYARSVERKREIAKIDAARRR